MGRTTWLLGQDEITPKEREELADRWMESIMRLARSELMGFPQVRIHMDIETGVLASDVIAELLGSWRRIEGGKDGFCRLCRRMIRNDLLNYADKIKAQYRAPHRNRESLDQRRHDLEQEIVNINFEIRVDWLELALERMEDELPDVAAVIHRRFAGEESLRVIGQAVDKSPDTVSRLVKRGLAWLADQGKDCDWI